MAYEAHKKPLRARPPWFKCRGCGGLPTAPMIEHELWATISAKYGHPERGDHDLLCIECVEKALGRHIEVEDLHDCLGNEFTRVYAKRKTHEGT